MDYRFETAARDIVRATDGDNVRFIPATLENSEYRLLSRGCESDEAKGLPAIAPVHIADFCNEEA